MWGSGGWHCDRIVGIIGSAANTGHGITGIAPDCPLYVYNADDVNVGADAYGLADALDRAMLDGCKIVSVSWFHSDFNTSSVLRLKLASFAASGGILCMAGADRHEDDSATYSTFIDNIVLVGGISNTDTKAANSGYGASYNIVAPFDDIISYSFDASAPTQESNGLYTTRS